jgi:hypothetical protein
MALGVDQLIDFLDQYFRVFHNYGDGVKLEPPQYHHGSDTVRLVMLRRVPMAHLPGMTADIARRELPAGELYGGADRIIARVSDQLSDMRRELMEINSEPEPDGQED